MLRLTLVRHGKAVPAHAGQEDFDRALEPDGHREVLQLGRRLRERELKPACLISSPALRALTTANLLARELSYPGSAVISDERLYLISADAILEWLRAADRAAQHLMIVGHNPGLSEFAARVAQTPIADGLATGTACTLRLPIEHWRDLMWRCGIGAEIEPRG